MNKDNMYIKVAQEYYRLEQEKRDLVCQQININAKLETIEDMLCELNDILCRYGKHVYEHFEENNLLESEVFEG